MKSQRKFLLGLSTLLNASNRRLAAAERKNPRAAKSGPQCRRRLRERLKRIGNTAQAGTQSTRPMLYGGSACRRSRIASSLTKPKELPCNIRQYYCTKPRYASRARRHGSCKSSPVFWCPQVHEDLLGRAWLRKNSPVRDVGLSAGITSPSADIRVHPILDSCCNLPMRESW